jgi:hypothetical protein
MREGGRAGRARFLLPDDWGSPEKEREEKDSARQDWNADRPSDADSLDTLWIRWTDGGSDLHFHRICEIIPQFSLSRSWPFIRAIPEQGKKPRFRPISKLELEDEEEKSSQPVQFKFLSGVPRQLLRHVPLVVFVSAVILFGGAEFDSTVEGVLSTIPGFSETNALLFGIFLVIVPFLLWLFAQVEVIDSDEFPEAVGIYGLTSVLVLGVVVSLLFVASVDHPSEIRANIVITSGYLLLLLLGGMLLYDAVLRIENMFVKLGERENDIVNNQEAYWQFLTDLNVALNEKRILSIHPSRLFGILFAGQFLIVWIIGSGPQNLNYSVGLVVNFLLNAILVTIVFKFFVLVRYFNKLMNETTEYSEVGLRYEPFHIDGYGGFRDFGRFATRINIILTLGGTYLVYRLYIVGGRTFPAEGFAGFTDPVVLSVWLVSFVGPVAAYTLGIGAWGYYSFWSMHVKMERDKQMFARQYQGNRASQDYDRTPSAGDSINSFKECEGPEWEAFRAAPTWPLDVNKMISLLSSNAIPLIIPVVNLFL